MNDAVDTAAVVRSPPSLRPSMERARISAGHRRKALALVLCALFVGLVVVPRAIDLLGFEESSKVRVTKRTLDAYVHEAYPAWRRVTSRACPTSIGELNAFIGRRDAIDVWAKPFAMYCIDTRSGAHTIVVRSAGEDTKYGTTDDLWSDR